MARSRIALVLPALVALSVAFSADAGGKKCRMHDKEKPGVTFKIAGPLGLKIDGSSKDLTVEDDGSKITLKASLTNLKTGIDFRDNHLREHINAKKWPAASLVVDKAQLKIPGSGEATGKFKLHGKEVDKKFHYNVKRKGDQLEVSGNFQVDLTQHGLDKACKAGVCTDKIVKVEAKFKALES
jgi:polyisoprenoid-binding protein YceI